MSTPLEFSSAIRALMEVLDESPQDVVVVMRLLKKRFSAAAAHEDLAPVRQRFERLLAEHPELRELSERLDREPEGEA